MAIAEIARWFRQTVCLHEWQQYPFAALSGSAPVYRCVKCGKHHQESQE